MEGLNLVATEALVAVRMPAEAPRERLKMVFVGCGEALYRFIVVRAGRDRDVADELLQQTCCEAARHRAIPEADSECEAWLFGIARNLIRKHWRRVRRNGVHIPLEDPAAGRALAAAMESSPMPIEALTRYEAATQLMLAITALPSTDQRLILDVYFNGRCRTEVAEEMGLTAKAVEARLYRIRNRLRAKLRGEERNVR